MSPADQPDPPDLPDLPPLVAGLCDDAAVFPPGTPIPALYVPPRDPSSPTVNR